jgi:CHAD domain-containing protein
MSHIPPAERLVRQRADALTRTLCAARTGDVDGIHQARVATRRLREALPLLPAGGRRRRVVNAVRKLTQALGPVRELDVSLEGLRELELRRPQWKTALGCAREMMLEDRRAALLSAIERVDKWDPARVRRASHTTGRESAPASTAVSARRERLALLRRRAARRANQVQGAVEHAAGVYLPDRLHDVRIATKKLRYVLETTEQMAGRAPSSRTTVKPSARSMRGRIAVLRQVQDLLGRLHDQEMLILRLRAAQGALEGPRVELAGEFDPAVRFLEMECRRLHGQYMTVRPRLLDVCTRIIAATHPRRRASAA